MTHYQSRLEEDLGRIRRRVAAIGSDVHKAVKASVQALIQGDRDTAYALMLGDLRINREIRAIDALCHKFVARHLPAAGHLRFVSAVLRINIALERIGDYAVTICRQAVQLKGPPPAQLVRDLELIADQSVEMLDQCTRAFAESNAELARGTKAIAARVDHTYEHILEDFLEAEKARPLPEVIALLAVFNKLERVSDQAKNICEDVVFIVTGETKPPKKYKVLFIDPGDDSLGRIAQALGRKSFPHACYWDTAGWAPAAAVRADAVAAADALGMELDGAKPRSIASLGHDLGDYHVLVSLAGDPGAHLAEIPFHSVLQKWHVGAGGGLEGAGRALADRIADLVEVLLGAEADG